VITSEHKVYYNSGNENVLALVGYEGLEVLDVGCGAGSLAKRLQATGKIVDGISISPGELAQAGPFLRNGFLYNLENGLPPELPTESYDYIICSHILEHIAYPDKLLQDMQRVLKKDGCVIVALPNVFHYKSRIQLLKGNFPKSDTGIWDATHLRWYTFKTASEKLSEYFNIETATVSGELPLNSMAKKIFPAKMSQFLFKLLTGVSKGLFGYQLLYRLTKKK